MHFCVIRVHSRIKKGQGAVNIKRALAKSLGHLKCDKNQFFGFLENTLKSIFYVNNNVLIIQPY